MIPAPLGDYDPAEVISAPVLDKIKSLRVFVVEEIRTARRYLSAAGLKGRIDELDFHELNEHTSEEEVEALIGLFKKGNDVGLISEAGLPAVADPGASLVSLCHKEGISVVPFTGPSSLMLALMSSGLNGQSFAFCGYLPAKPEERRKALKNIEKLSLNTGQTQIFIETPYRNDAMLKDILDICHKSTYLCVASNITMPDAFIKTMRVEKWKEDRPVLGKKPCVFIISA